MRRTIIIAALALGVLALGACGGRAPSKSAPTATAPPTYTISGSVALKGTLFSMDNSDTVSYQINGPCFGTHGYDDLKAGAAVVVTNQNGTTIGSSSLDEGQLPKDPAEMKDPTAPTTCTFAFVVGSVPRASFYKIEVAHRGQVTYSFDQLASNGWSAKMAIGD
jgi:hypothetical protein